MPFVICMVPVCPMRKEASHRSEMVSQLLFGEQAEVLERSGQFVRIRSCFDLYEGWCSLNQLQDAPHQLPENGRSLLCADWVNTIQLNGRGMQVSLGTSLSLFTQGEFHPGAYHAVYAGRTWDASGKPFTEQLIKEIAFFFLNTPYLWGGRSVFGIDCSGYVQQVYRFFDKKLPRDAYLQAEQGEAVGFLQEVVCGDLAFFDNEEGRITHVGIMLDASTIIHASGKVRIDPIDQAGIVQAETGERTHRLRIIKRFS